MWKCQGVLNQSEERVRLLTPQGALSDDVQLFTYIVQCTAGVKFLRFLLGSTANFHEV